MRKANGFTIVEILIVVGIIGILSTIGFIGFGRYQADTRDSGREAKASIIVEALEKYYDKNGEYPSCPSVTGPAATVTTSVLPGLDAKTLVAPQAASGTTNSLACTDLTDISQADFFAYVGDTSSTCTTGQACLLYNLKYKQESTGQIITINSRRKTNIAFTSAPTLSSTTISFSQINTTWTAVGSAVSYDLVRATDNAFTANVVSQNTANTSMSVTGLSYNTTYYFRARANSATGSGSWSSTVIASTWTLAAPTTSASTASSTSFTQTWNAITHATGYTAQCSSNGTSWGTGCQLSTAATSHTYGGAAQGYKYYVRVQATNGGYTSAWSNVASATTTIDSPAAPIVTQSSDSTTTTLSWSAVSCPSGTSAKYRYKYAWGSNNWGYVESGSNRSVSLPTFYEGNTYYFYASAECTSAVTSSGWSGDGTASYYRPVNNPGPISFWISVHPGRTNLHASSSCTGFTYLYSTYDTWVGSGYVWTDTGVGGWWADSHGGTWAAGGWNYWGYNNEVTISFATNYPSGTLFALRVYFRCQNYGNGAFSGTIYGQSGQMATP